MKPRITPTIMDGIVVRWGDKNGDAQISTSRNGVLVHGWMLRVAHDRDEFHAIVVHAWECYRFLAQRAERFSSASGDEVRAFLAGRGIEFEEPTFP